MNSTSSPDIWSARSGLRMLSWACLAAFFARRFASGVALGLALFFVLGFLAVDFFEEVFLVEAFLTGFFLAFEALGFVLVMFVGVGGTPTSSERLNATL